jgi:hypothetical protein
MHHGLQQLCEQFFAEHVETLFEQARARGVESLGATNLKYQVLKTPYLGLLYSAVDDDLIAQLKPMVVRALAWRERFRQTKPSWAPELPINLDEIGQLQNGCSRRMRQVGDFGYSLLLSQWDEAHPEFTTKQWQPDDEQLEQWERFAARMNAGILHRGHVCQHE